MRSIGFYGRMVDRMSEIMSERTRSKFDAARESEGRVKRSDAYLDHTNYRENYGVAGEFAATLSSELQRDRWFIRNVKIINAKKKGETWLYISFYTGCDDIGAVCRAFLDFDQGNESILRYGFAVRSDIACEDTAVPELAQYGDCHMTSDENSEYAIYVFEPTAPIPYKEFDADGFSVIAEAVWNYEKARG